MAKSIRRPNLDYTGAIRAVSGRCRWPERSSVHARCVGCLPAVEGALRIDPLLQHGDDGSAAVSQYAHVQYIKLQLSLLFYSSFPKSQSQTNSLQPIQNSPTAQVSLMLSYRSTRVYSYSRIFALA